MSNDAFSPQDLSWSPIDPKWITLKRWRMIIGWGVFALIAGAPFVAAYVFHKGPQWLLWVGGAVVLAVVGTLIFRLTRAPRLWRAWGYAERGEDLYIRYGIWFRRLTIVPYGRMQMVKVEAGPIERLLGLARVKLETASSGTEAEIVGLSAADADRLRTHLIERGNIETSGL